MSRRHIALFPLPHKPHILPFLGLCPELLRRGYRVTLATDEIHSEYAILAGAEPVIFEPCKTLPTRTTTEQLPAGDPRCWEEIGTVLYPWLLNTAVLATRQLDDFYKVNRPDLVIYEFAAYAGCILAKRLHSPSIQYYPDFIHESGCAYWENGLGYNPQSMFEFSKLLDALLWAYGFERPNNLRRSENLNLYQFPREFQFDSALIDSDRFSFVGPFLERPFHPVWKNRSRGKRIILVSAITGSNDTKFFNMIIDALSGSEYYVILSVDEEVPVSQLRELPENFEISKFASHLEILPNTDVHLYSGEKGGTIEGLYFGVPLIALPSFVGNCQRASRLAELGVGLNLPLHALTSQMVQESIETVLRDDVLLGRVRHMKDVVRSSGGTVMAVERIEEFLTACDLSD